jgi:hypothetical protein
MTPTSPRTFYYHASANSLGGHLQTPHKKVVPTQASAALSEVGGHAAGRTENFNCDEIVRCKLSYTTISGVQVEGDGSWATLVTSVVEGFNLLDVVTADRIVGQVSVNHPADGSSPTFSISGSQYYGLRIAGHEITPKLNSTLLALGSGTGVDWPIFQTTGNTQAGTIVGTASAGKNAQWVVNRFTWMTAKPKAGGHVICSLVDAIPQPMPGRSIGHVIEIPHFGKILLGELVAHPTSVQLTMIRAELGCATQGQITACSVMANGHTVPP